MTQRDLNRSVARATGETVSEVSRHGFTKLTPLPAEADAEQLILDWDRAQAERNVALFRRRESLALA